MAAKFPRPARVRIPFGFIPGERDLNGAGAGVGLLEVSLPSWSAAAARNGLIVEPAGYSPRSARSTNGLFASFAGVLLVLALGDAVDKKLVVVVREADHCQHFTSSWIECDNCASA